MQAISFDRGRVARNPLTRTCSMNPFWRVIFIWSFSLLIAAPLGVSRKFDPCISNPYKCSKVKIMIHILLFGMWICVYICVLKSWVIYCTLNIQPRKFVPWNNKLVVHSCTTSFDRAKLIHDWILGLLSCDTLWPLWTFRVVIILTFDHNVTRPTRPRLVTLVSYVVSIYN